MRHTLYIVVLISLFLPLGLSAQVFYGNGAPITVTQGGNISVISDDMQIATGNLDNAGLVEVGGNFINDGTTTGGGTTGVFEVEGDWVNNGNFIADQSTVRLIGTTQAITGTAITSFYDLHLLGLGVKTQTINAITANTLNLENAELATGNFEHAISNPSSTSLLRATGFVSSTGSGRLSRATNSTNTYLFPTGSSLGTVRYRPLNLVPNTPDPAEFGARLANVEASVEGHDRTLHDEVLCATEPDFFHRLYRTSGSQGADVQVLYVPDEDGYWQELANWSGGNWNQVSNTSPTSNGFFNAVTINDWQGFSNNPLLLASRRPILEVGEDHEINRGQTAEITPIYFGNPAETIQWTPELGLDCPTCESVMAGPEQTTTYVLQMIDDHGCVATDSLVVRVNPDQLLLPTAFTPNGDGVNDVFRILNENVRSATVYIYNRWGEVVYQSDDPLDGWDGTHKSVAQGMGVYSYVVQYTLDGEERSSIGSGNVTLLR